MKRFMKALFVALVVSALASFSVLAGDKGKVEKKTITFPEDVMVNGTLVKAGVRDEPRHRRIPDERVLDA